jgi:hypothetical protein
MQSVVAGTLQTLVVAFVVAPAVFCKGLVVAFVVVPAVFCKGKELLLAAAPSMAVLAVAAAVPVAAGSGRFSVLFVSHTGQFDDLVGRCMTRLKDFPQLIHGYV